ncbi:MAG: NAD(P)-dependent oxidoreductase [Ktedonobacteraceae bacterium]|nr:NAD(P)-dependent oxidoreductase [Ktedonobacteraceae bacterium]
MGQGMAASLLKKGFTLTVWNRDKSKTEPLVAQGARLAESAVALADTCDVYITMLRDDQAVRDVLLGSERNGALFHAHPGQTFIDMSTVTPALTRELAQIAEKQGVSFLEAPVTGSKTEAASGTLTILVGGTAEVLESQRDVLRAMAQAIVHVGPIGAATSLKLANNQFIASLMAALGEGILMTDAAGVDRTLAIETLVNTAGRVTQLKKNKIIERDWSVQFTIDLLFKDAHQAQSAANEYMLPMPVLAAAHEVLQRARHAGKGDLDYSALVEAIEQLI